MSRITGRAGLLSVGAIILLAGVGCGDRSPAEPASVSDHPADPGVEASAPIADPPMPTIPHQEMAENLAAGELPLQFPRRVVEGASSPDDVNVADTQPSGGGLFDVLRQTVDMSAVFEQTGVQDGLSDSLSAASDQLNRQKRDNFNAIRRANRQARVGQALTSPNLVLISVEALGYGDLACYGSEVHETPNLDRLAQRGLRFTDFYAGSARPRASRWCLMTGNNTGRAPVVEAGSQRFALQSFASGNKLLPDVLWNSGYTTALVGVWDEQDNPLNYGYEQWGGLPAQPGEFDSYPEVVYLDAARARLPGNSEGREGVHVGDLLLQESLSFLNQNARGERPCFLHLALPEFDAASLHDDTALPPNVAEVDRIVGGLLDWIDERELNSRTCVILMGVSAPDSGETSESLARTGNLSVHISGLSEGNLRLPLIACWEGRIPAGEQSEHVCAVWDVLPTLADLAVVMRRPQRLDGLSFMGELLGRTQPEHRLLYWETREHGFGQAVRMGRWKGVRLPRQTTLSLFDLETDPAEQHDLSSERPEVVEQLVVRE